MTQRIARLMVHDDALERGESSRRRVPIGDEGGGERGPAAQGDGTEARAQSAPGMASAAGDAAAGDEEEGDSEEGDSDESESDESDTGGASARTTTAARELQELRDKHLRLAAEYDNYRKRTTRERQEAGTRAQAELIRQIVDSLDDLSRVIAVDPASADVETVVQGVEMVERKLLKSLAAAGLEVIHPIDQAFDPALHEAVATEPALSREDDHLISRVFQPGYRFNGQLVRPARVVVRQWQG